MKIDFTGRGLDITNEIREFTKSKMERLKKLVDDIHDATIILSVEKYRHRAEINFLSQKRSFHGSEETSDMFQSIDRVVDKLENQLRKAKDKLQNRKKHTSDTIRIQDDDPILGSNAAPQEKEIQIIPSDVASIKPMSLEEAVDELTRFKQEFLVYINPQSEAANVVYRRKDGHIGYFAPAK